MTLSPFQVCGQCACISNTTIVHESDTIEAFDPSSTPPSVIRGRSREAREFYDEFVKNSVGVKRAIVLNSIEISDFLTPSAFLGEALTKKSRGREVSRKFRSRGVFSTKSNMVNEKATRFVSRIETAIEVAGAVAF